MKKRCMSLFTAVSLTLGISAAFADPQSDHQGSKHHETAAETESVHADVKQHKNCQICGMDRNTFSKSRILVTYADGKSIGTCSIACLANELKSNQGKTVKSVQVGDYSTKYLIDAKKAVWVIGGDQRGVMTRIAKWAFAKKSEAETFTKKHGGKITNYEEALRQAEAE